MRLHPFCALFACLILAGCGEAPTAPLSDPNALPPGVYALARGAGVLAEGADSLQFSFIVKNQGLPGGMSATGTIDGAKVKFMGSVTSVSISGTRVTFEGDGTVNGQQANFYAIGVDDATDQLTVKITMTGQSYDIQGPLSTGHVNIETTPSPLN